MGSESCSEKLVKLRVEEICEDPVDCGTVICGDIEDEDRPSTRERRRSAFADRPEVNTRDSEKHMAWLDKAVIPLLLPLQNTKYGIMGVLAGHHWTQVTPANNSVQYICNELTRLSKKKVSYLGEMSSFMDFRFKSGERGLCRTVGHVQHGEGGGQTKGSTIAKLDRTAQGFEADWYIRAHDCQIVASKVDRLYTKEVHHGTAPDLMSRTIAFLNLGSATRGYDFNKNAPSYIEAKMMRPVTMGWGSISFVIRKARAFEDVNANYKIDMRVTI